ncbi:hypothetical protein M885DRAFT_460525 [Pelagophyceae sp. CCMP2097]|nr:hypothetical protein M885DRAFT_460525 [Pelagophyceae sp. CCMP2097]|mmetsp:Transcript_26961/g.90640  ORF Transcript_26961/g.90640 Transcript_26961/m.90640 type:complete len:464 (-) Transcript_26961:202-1593(-)
MAQLDWVKGAGKKASTTDCGKRIWTAALEAAGLSSESVAAEKDWRHDYAGAVVALADAMMESPEVAVSAAQAGLDALYKEFVIGDVPLMDAMRAPVGAFKTATLASHGGAKSVGVDVAELARLAQKGSVEWSAVFSCRAVVDGGGNLFMDEATRSRTLFVVLGGTAEMGPTKPLLSLGATVAAVCRGGQKWADLVEFAKTTDGALLAPSSDGDVATAGADVLADAPKIAAWIASLAEDFDRVVIGSYIYLDGEAHVRACVACDAIATRAAELAGGKVALAYLVSPGTAYAVDAATVADCDARYHAAPYWQRIASGALRIGGGGYVPNARFGNITNGLSVVQGPNYALAKTLQNWRCVVAHAAGVLVSANLAPPARTASMVAKNAAVGRWLDGVQKFEPYSTFEPHFASHVMAALLVRDVERDTVKYAHPMLLLWDGAVHGGAPRCAFQGDSIAKSAVAASFFG